MRYALLLTACLAVNGCYRTHYVNLSPNNPMRNADTYVPVHVTGWQHFFVWGWFPIEHRIDARKRCGGADKIDSIETRRTFLEGLVAAFAGYYINVYSPYHGAVYCTEEPGSRGEAG